MTKIIYTVVNRPKKDRNGRTDVSWLSECDREAVKLGGYLITSRATKGLPKLYYAVMLKETIEAGVSVVHETVVGDTFESRAQASFAIWRAYYKEWRDTRSFDRAWAEAEAEDRRRTRAKAKAFRQTPDGAEAYRLELNKKAQVRRDAMTPDEKQAVIDKRKAKTLQSQVTNI